MKKFFRRIFKVLDINRRDFVIFMLALLLAFSIWLLHNLSLNYTAFVSAHIIAKSNIEYHAEESVNRCMVSARLRTTGYNLLRLHRGEKNPKVVEIPSSYFHPFRDDIFYTTTQELQELSADIFGEKATVDFLIADTLKFRFPAQNYKKVPVRPVKLMDLSPQYMMPEELEINPDSVIVYGDSRRLQSLDYVLTEPITIKDNSLGNYGDVALKKENGLRLSTSSVRYSADLSRFTEIVSSLPVYARNLPSDKELIYFPANVTVSFKCIFPVRSNPQEEVVLYVDYNDYLKSLSGKCPVHISGIGPDIFDYKIEPSTILCIVNEKRR